MRWRAWRAISAQDLPREGRRERRDSGCLRHAAERGGGHRGGGQRVDEHRGVGTDG